MARQHGPECLDVFLPFPSSLQLSHSHCAHGTGCAALSVTVGATGLGCLSVCPSLLPFPSPSGVGALRLRVTAGDKVSTNGSKLLNYMLFKSLVYLKQYFYSNSELQSPLDTFVICVLLSGFHWQRRDEPSENDRLFCFDEKMSPKGNLFNASLF